MSRTKIGSAARPAHLRVSTRERLERVVDECRDRGFHAIVGLEPGQREDLSGTARLGRPVVVVRALPRVRPELLCPCGSERLYDACCGAEVVAPGRAPRERIEEADWEVGTAVELDLPSLSPH